MKIVFFGTPDFAVESLYQLVNSKHKIVGVVTVEDKKSGRGQKISLSPVKIFAEKHCLKILQPHNLKDEKFIQELKSLNADIFAVVAFRKLPEVVWKMPKHGTINLHASLLPDYRGAAPINWAIINGEEVTGATTFFINENIDTGDILLKSTVQIDDSDTAGDLHDKIMNDGAKLLVRTINQVEDGTISPVKQEKVSLPKKAPKIHKEDCMIDWSKSAQSIYNFIRGLSPYPASYTTFKGKIFKIYSSEKKLITELKLNPGEIHSDNKNFLLVGCSDGILSLNEVQIQGKKRLDIKEFLKGNKIEENSYFE